MATKPVTAADTPTSDPPSTPDELTDLNRRIAEEAAKATTAEARQAKSSG